MKHSFLMIILVAGLLILPPTIQAQDCRNWSLWDTRGTYATTAGGWIDLSAMNPALPQGYSPFSSIGAFTNDGRGGGTGWALINAGGVQLTIQFVDVQFGAPGADCLQPFSYSYKIKELGDVTVGPVSFPGVIAGDMSALEIFAMAPGAGPGTPVQSGHAKRISLKFD